METKERYVIHQRPEPTTDCPFTEAPQNGQSRPADGPMPGEGQPREWVEADRVIVHLILAKKRGTPERSLKIGEVNYLDAQQRPIALFADADDPDHPWGTALEKFIADAVAKGTEQLQEWQSA